jgi:rhamnosyltransferase
VLLSSARVVIPTYNAGPHFAALRDGLSLQEIEPRQVLVVDSSSSDGTASLFERYGADVVCIPKADFNHGGTRRMAARLAAEADPLIFLTQDAIPVAAGSFRRLIAAFADPSVGMAYGRQLPRPSAGAIERHARLANYPDGEPQSRTLDDRARLGIKTVFCSNSFAAYRKQALQEVGGFPEDTFFGEDQIVAGKMLIARWSIAYVPSATVTHSHGYSIREEFRRYFDVGAFHARNPWLLETFGRAEGEGLRFIRSEMRFLWRAEPTAIPGTLIRNVAKYLGYRLGRLERLCPAGVKARLSMAGGYWLKGER